MRGINTVKYIFLFITTLICCAITYPLLHLTVEILNSENILASLATGFIIVPLGLGLYIASLTSSLWIFISGLINKTKVWWILGILLLLANVGAVAFAFLY